MARTPLTAVAALAAAAALAPSAGAGAAFSGKACGLLKPSQLQTVDISAGCKPAKTATARTATIYGAVWSDGLALKDNRLSVQIWKPNGSAFAALFKKEAQGTPVKIGSFARADITINGETISLLANGYGVLIALNHWAHSTADNTGEIGAAMATIAKKIAVQLS